MEIFPTGGHIPYAHMGKLKKFDKYGQGKFTLPEFRKFPFFGGSYCTRRAFRVRRPLSTKEPIHLVLRSTRAKGAQSFISQRHRKAIAAIILKFGQKWGIKIEQFANVGNHLHLLIRVKNFRTYKPFICALTGRIAGLVTDGKKLDEKFWDYRPFSRIVHGLRGWLTMRDYMEINQYEGGGCDRGFATLLVKSGIAMETG